MNNKIFAFRAFDLRDHFPEPFCSFRDALEALQSDRAYMPNEHGEIICYLKGGGKIRIPAKFFMCQKPFFESKKEAEAWLSEADDKEKICGYGDEIVTVDPGLSREKQVEQLLKSTENEIINSSENDRVCEEVEAWLGRAISSFPPKN